MPIDDRNIARFEPARSRSRMMRIGSSGLATRTCETTKAINRTPAATSMPTVSPEPQPFWAALEKP